MFKLDGQILQLDVPFTHNDIQYPANWLRLSSKEEKDALGIEEIEVQTRPDDRFYFVSDNGNGTYSSVPKNIDDLKNTLISQVKQTAQSILLQTDWMVVKSIETETPLKSSVKIFRDLVRKTSNDLETSINSSETIEELQQVKISDWPSYNF